MPKRIGIEESLPGVQTGAQGVDKRSELEYHIEDYLVAGDGDAALPLIDGTAEANVRQVVIDLDEAVDHSGIGQRLLRNGGVWKLRWAIYFANTDGDTKKLALALRIGVNGGEPSTDNIYWGATSVAGFTQPTLGDTLVGECYIRVAVNIKTGARALYVSGRAADLAGALATDQRNIPPVLGTSPILVIAGSSLYVTLTALWEAGKANALAYLHEWVLERIV